MGSSVLIKAWPSRKFSGTHFPGSQLICSVQHHKYQEAWEPLVRLSACALLQLSFPGFRSRAAAKFRSSCSRSADQKADM